MHFSLIPSDVMLGNAIDAYNATASYYSSGF